MAAPARKGGRQGVRQVRTHGPSWLYVARQQLGSERGGMPVPPLPDVGTDDMDDLILYRWNRLPEALKFDLDYAPHCDA